jgi:hypothetical protein
MLARFTATPYQISAYGSRTETPVVCTTPCPRNAGFFSPGGNMQVTIEAQNDATLQAERIGGTIVITVDGKPAELSERQALDLIEAIHSEES